MRNLITALATAAILIVGSLVWKAEAAMTTGVGGLLPRTNSYTPQGVACWCGPYRCACRRRYWGPRYGYYGYRPYGYYGYGRRWRY
jgi:hypothetical protein